MKIIIIIQARMNSSRLPGKVLFKLKDKSVLSHVINRCQQIELATEVVVATTTNEIDDKIYTEATSHGVFCFRGSEDNVLERYYLAATERSADVIVRITSDCPLIDPELSNHVIKTFLDDVSIDCCHLSTSFPKGLDTEVFSYSSLKEAYNNNTKAYEREHVTPYIYEQSHKFKVKTIENYEDQSSYRWTLDTEEDWQLIQAIYNQLYNPGHIFERDRVHRLMQEQPELLKINHNVKQKPIS